MGFRGVMYNDVYSIDAPHQCFDPNHPCYGDDAAEYARLTLEKCAELGGVASEGGYDHVLTLSLRHPNQRFSQSSVSMR